MTLLFSVLAPVLVMMLLEYGVHRWWQHSRHGPGFASHVIGHHGARRPAFAWWTAAKIWVIVCVVTQPGKTAGYRPATSTKNRKPPQGGSGTAPPQTRKK